MTRSTPGAAQLPRDLTEREDVEVLVRSFHTDPPTPLLGLIFRDVACMDLDAHRR